MKFVRRCSQKFQTDYQHICQVEPSKFYDSPHYVDPRIEWAINEILTSLSGHIIPTLTRDQNNEHVLTSQSVEDDSGEGFQGPISEDQKDSPNVGT